MSTLKQSVPDWCFFKEGMDPRSYYGRLKSLGYEGVELVDPARWDAAKAAGLAIVDMAAPGIKEGVADPANRAPLAAEIRRSLETARANGIEQVIVFSGNRKGMDPEEGLRLCISFYKELVPAAERLGVTMTFEMLNTFDHPDYMACNSRFGFELAKAVSSPRFKVLYDVYHMQRMGEDVRADVLGHLDSISHLHVAGSPRRDFPGTRQEIDYAGLVKAVTAAGYARFWGQEFLPSHPDPFSELEAAAMLFSRYAQQ